jgi:hypothetical protein
MNYFKVEMEVNMAGRVNPKVKRIVPLASRIVPSAFRIVPSASRIVPSGSKIEKAGFDVREFSVINNYKPIKTDCL